MSIKTKQELLAAFAETSQQGIADSGPVSYTLFEDIEYYRAMNIAKDMWENVLSWLDEHSNTTHVPEVGMVMVISVQLSLIEFGQVCLRNIELNTEMECMHATFQIGYLFNYTQVKLRALKSMEGDQL